MASRYTLITLFFLLIATWLSAQQKPQFSQRSIDPYAYNPAVVGSKLYTEFMWHNRSQWKGFEGAPKSSMFTLQMRMNRLMGIGLSFFKDEIGPQKTVGFQATYSHHITMDRINLSFGLSGDVLQYGMDGNLLTIKEINDNAINQTVFDKQWRPDASFGSYLYNDNFFVGFSVQNLLGSTVEHFTDESELGQLDLVRHFYVNTGFTVSTMSGFDFDPSILWTMARGTPAQFDMNLNVQYLSKILMGFSYRIKDAMVVVAGVKLKERLKIAYSYDIVTSKIKTYNTGSHEIIMSFIIPSKDGQWNRWKHDYQYKFNPKTNKWRERW